MAKNRSEADATPEPDHVSIERIQREFDKMEFYKTYDLMTGVRIAATLGGFFGIMVLLVIYKSKCKSRSISDEKLEAVAAEMCNNGPGRKNVVLAENPCWLGISPNSQIIRGDIPGTPPALQVIQATPELSPSASKNSVYNGPWLRDNLHVPKIAPLASLSSFGIGSTDRDDHSVGSDSVFLDEELIDTEDEVEGFSTDSDLEKADIPSGSHLNSTGSEVSLTVDVKRSLRRYSSPNPYVWKKEKTDNDDNGSWRWRRFSGSWKQQQDRTRLPLPSNLSPNKETLF